ncbi:MAG: hypothetical protein JXB17_13105 [Bacteroidales bacterium]|nr:hypothetical protein [Bacteroidales bacterium]
MKYFILVLIATFCSNILIAQSPSNEVPDTIFMLSGKKIYARIIGITSSKLTYREMGKSDVESIDRKQVQKIVYKNGRKEIFNKPVFQVLEEGDWKTVILTNNPGDVEGLTKKGEVNAKSTGSAKTKKTAKRSAEMQLQKKAANLGAQIVLVKKIEALGGYGEIPSYYMEGVAYGFDW